MNHKNNTPFELRIGICGLGTVGGAVIDIIERNRSLIETRCNRHIVIQNIATRTTKPQYSKMTKEVSQDIFDVAKDPNVDLLVETIGGTSIALDLINCALDHGKHVVTANKALIAEHGNQLLDKAEKQGLRILFEASVAGGIPVLKALREGLNANQFKWIAGIVNGTSNYILTQMRDEGWDFAKALSTAQALGYAEADPTFDIEGVDAAHKLAILASIGFAIPFAFDSIHTQGISEIDIEDIKLSEQLGYALKHLAITCETASGVQLRVHPTLIPSASILSKVDGVMNAVMVGTDATGSTIYYGAGAGAEPTASAVIADIMDIARSGNSAPENTVPCIGVAVKDLKPKKLLAIEQCQSEHYLRFKIKDQAGALNLVTQCLTDADISIDVMRQIEVNSEQATIVLITHPTIQLTMFKAVEALELLPVVISKPVMLRVENFV